MIGGFAGPTTLRILAIVAAMVSLALSATSVMLIALTPGLDPFGGWGFVGYDAVFSVAYLTVGLLITTRRPHNVIGWLFLISALLSGAQTAATSYGEYALRLGREGGAVGLWISGWIWLPAVAVIVLTLLLYPNGRLPSPRWRWAAVGLIPVTTLATLLWAVAAPPEAASGQSAFTVDPLGLASDHPLRALAGPSLLLLTAWFLIAAASLVARMRGGTAVERQQVKWIAFGAALLGLTLGASVVASLVAPDAAFAKATQIVSVAAVLLIPIAATVAILRYRLYDIDLLINRTIVYGAVSALLLAAYAAAVVVLQTVLRPITGGSEFAVALSTLLVAALFQPVRASVQRTVDRRFYRSRYDTARTLDAFGARLRDQVDLDSVRAHMVAVLHETVRPTHASVWLRERE